MTFLSQISDKQFVATNELQTFKKHYFTTVLSNKLNSNKHYLQIITNSELDIRNMNTISITMTTLSGKQKQIVT